ncbi:MAG: PEP-CTERM sorting domain-containing protein [Planctomycetia bacterium]|nr:PEP-CTERM sorting domain-containing protein [Planctomycetia bacterium]
MANGGWFTAAGNTWQIDYAATSGGINFTADQTSGRFITITAVPEPGGIALAAAGIALAAWRVAVRRRGRRSPGFSRQPVPPPDG